MKWSQTPVFTLKEAPADVDVVSYQLLVRGGYMRRVSQGLFTYGHLLLRSQRKLEKIIREELAKINCMEISMPMVQPRSLWDETRRWDKFGSLLLKMKNRAQADFCLGPTHEEVIVDYVRRDLKSYRELPLHLFQIQTKYRDEIRPRFGLLRAREFLMKDAYSFDLNKQASLESYEKYKAAYTQIFKRTGLEFCMVEADSGDIGGNHSHEFHVLAGRGEDELLVSDSGFASNKEVCPAHSLTLTQDDAEFEKLSEFQTPQVRTIEDLSKFTKIAEKRLVKTLFLKYEVSEKTYFICVLLRGCDELNFLKVKNILKLSALPEMATSEEVKTLTDGASPGSCGPVGLNDLKVIADEEIKGFKNYIVGANKDDYHLKNVNHDRDYKVSLWADVRFAKEGDLDPSDKSKTLKLYRGIEVGHIFYLSQVYSKSMRLEFTSESGELLVPEMGCYGIGVSRTLQAAIEQGHDEDGIIWPVPLAPYEVHICLLDPDDSAASDVAKTLYESLHQAGYGALMDDRSERPGVKFKDADLLGMPYRVVVGRRGLEKGVLEVRNRKTKEKTEFSPDQTLAWLLESIKKETV